MEAYQRRLREAIKLFDPSSVISQRDRRKMSDDEANALHKRYDRDSQKSLESVCAILVDAYGDGTLSSAEYQGLLQSAADHEHSVIEWAYRGVDDGFDYFPPYCGNVVKDNTLGPEHFKHSSPLFMPKDTLIQVWICLTVLLK